MHSYAELRSYLPNVPPAQRRKRVLAEGLPRRPGIYLFHGPADEVLYVGTAINLRRRVNQYFNGSDQRTRMKEMVALATRVEHVECAHALEAGVRELRMLSAHAPPYNRRSKFPQRWWWLVLSDEAFPRFSVVRAPRHDRALGPFRSRADAVDTADLLARFTGVRTCTKRLARSALHGPACPLHEVSPCPAARDVTPEQYGPAAEAAAALIDGLENSALAAAARRIAELAGRQRYESAARLARSHRRRRRGAVARTALAGVGRTARTGGGRPGRRGRLAARGHPARAARRGRHRPPRRSADASRHAIEAGAQVVLPQPAPLGGALVEETALIARWLAAPGVRIVRTSGEQGWCSPVRSAGPWAEWAAAARSARVAAEQAVTSRDSELLTEPHPTREQLFGRPAVDRLGGAAAARLPTPATTRRGWIAPREPRSRPRR